MGQIIIKGQKKLQGEVHISGAKNAAVAMIPASLLADGVCVIENLPQINDVKTLKESITKLGAVCTDISENTIEIDGRNIDNYTATFDIVKKMRASYYLLGALLGRFKKAEVRLPGGCDFGVRPIDQHIKGFRAMGAIVEIEHGVVKAYAEELHGANIYLDMVSVGATINIMLAATMAKGTTIIENAAKEPHVVDCANFLNMLGAKVKGAGTDVIKISGVEKLHGGTYQIIPDQIETGTYMIAAAATGGDIKVCDIIPKHMDSLSAKLQEMDCTIEEGDDYIRVIGSEHLKNANVKTMVYPGFPTDLQPQMTALLCRAKGVSIITETIFENRFQYITQLKRLGCKITVEGRAAIVEGTDSMTGADVVATDLRAGAALIICGLASVGSTTIGNTKYIDRGYDDIVKKLRNLGADIERID